MMNGGYTARITQGSYNKASPAVTNENTSDEIWGDTRHLRGTQPLSILLLFCGHISRNHTTSPYCMCD